MTPFAALARGARGAVEFARAMRAVQAACERSSAQLAELRLALRRLQQTVTGPARNFDPLDGTWQTDSCATWLHDFCPAASACDCTCHGGTRR
jgi:hypothetical protein